MKTPLLTVARSSRVGVHASQPDNGVRDTAGRPVRGGRVLRRYAPDRPATSRRVPGGIGGRTNGNGSGNAVRRRRHDARGGLVVGLPGRRDAAVGRRRRRRRRRHNHGRRHQMTAVAADRRRRRFYCRRRTRRSWRSRRW